MQWALEVDFEELARMFKAPELVGAGFIKHGKVMVKLQTAGRAPTLKSFLASSSPRASQPTWNYLGLGRFRRRPRFHERLIGLQPIVYVSFLHYAVCEHIMSLANA